MKLPKNWKKVRADVKHYSLKEQIVLPLMILKEKPDLVHFPHFNIPYFMYKKFIVTVHDMTMHKQGINATNLPLPIYLLKRVPYKMIFEKAVKRSKKIITPSNTVKNEVVEYYNIPSEKVNVIYEGIDDKFFEEKRQVNEMEVLTKYGLAGKDYLFYMGNAYPHKNLQIVIKAILDVNNKKNKKCYFAIAGSRDVFMKKLHKQIKEVGAEDLVKLIGFVSEQDSRVLYKNSAGFIYPSVSEGFGLQGLEAIASGTILLASNTPVFREIYNSHAFYFDPHDMTSVSSTIYSVLTLNNTDKHKYLDTAQEFIKRYSWKKMARETLEMYMSVNIRNE
jgi:glycosyltransferase involved in cell wall biosynthesis